MKFKIGDNLIYIGDSTSTVFGKKISLYGRKCQIFVVWGNMYHIKFPLLSLHIKFPTMEKNLVTEEEFEKLKQTKKDNLLKYKDIDPYGEEVWENVSDKEFEIGDIVVYIGKATNLILKNGRREEADLYGEKCKIENILKSKFGIRYEIKIIKINKTIITLEDRIATEEEFEKLEQKRKDNLLKFKDIDPYGEEIWENKINENNKFKIILVDDIIKKHDNYDDFFKEIYDLLIGESVTVYYFDIHLKKYRLYSNFNIVKEISKRKILKYDKLTIDNPIFRISVEDIYLNDKLVIKYKSEPIHTDIDPYGEEDWNEETMDRNYFDKIVNESIIQTETTAENFPQKCVVLINTQLDYNILMMELENLDYEWGCGHNPTTKDYFNKYNNFCISITDKKILYGNLDYYKNTHPYNKYKFIHYNNKKYNKIEKPEIDPYGEEDWGFEKIQENFPNNFKISLFEMSISFKETMIDKLNIITSHWTIPGFYLYNDKTNEYLLDQNSTNIKFYFIGGPGPSYDTWLGCTFKQNGELKRFHILKKDYHDFYLSNKKKSKIVFNEVDPYGEEEWDDIQERKLNNFSNFVNKNKGIEFKIGDDVICKKGHQDGYDVEGWEGKIVSKDDSGAGRLNGVIKYGNMCYIKFDYKYYIGHFWIFSELLKHIDPEKAELIRKKKEKIRLKHIDIDPYGEEDWENESRLNENNKYNIILVSDIYKKHDNYNDFFKEMEDLLNGNEIAVYYFNTANEKYSFYAKYNIGKIGKRPYAEKNYKTLNNENAVLYCGEHHDDEKLYLDDKIIIKYKSAPKYTELDPYGEEDWDENNINDSELNKMVNESINENDLISIKEMYDKYDYPQFLDEMKKLLIDKKIDIYDRNLIKVMWTKRRDKVVVVNNDFINKTINLKSNDAVVTINNEICLLYLDYIKIKDDKPYINPRPDLDPYGEEDWLEENVKHEEIFKKLKKLAISFANKDEMVDIAKKLNDYGFEVFNYDKIMKYQNMENFYYFIYTNYFVRSGYNTHYRTDCDYYQFLNLIGKKYKKIENPIVDPYGEEDWGYEEIKESVHPEYKKFFNYNIIFKDLDEAKQILLKLHKLGFKVDLNGVEYRITGWTAIVPSGDGFCFGRKSSNVSGHRDNLTFEEFLIMINNSKYKKIENPELDPYGEEDWGWEETKD